MTSKYDDLDIFDPELIYPSEIRGDRPKQVEEKKLPITKAEQRKLYQAKAKEEDYIWGKKSTNKWDVTAVNEG